jgi:ribonuclease P protein component
MGREARLHAAGEFQRVRSAGRSWSHPLVVLVAAPGGSPAGWTRIGITASRRVGGAVDRNRARRRISEAIRLRYDRIESGWDLVFIVRRPATGAAFGALAGAVETLLARAGLLVEELPCAGLPSA